MASESFSAQHQRQTAAGNGGHHANIILAAAPEVDPCPLQTWLISLADKAKCHFGERRI